MPRDARRFVIALGLQRFADARVRATSSPAQLHAAVRDAALAMRRIGSEAKKSAIDAAVKIGSLVAPQKM
jgi:hypothetical protein